MKSIKRMKNEICFFVLLFVIFVVTSLYYRGIKYINSNRTINQEVLLIAEFVQVRQQPDETCVSLGVVSFKIGNVLYGIGHASNLEDISMLCVYKTLPTFNKSDGNHLGYVSYNGYSNDLLGTVLQDSANGMVILSANFNTEKYSSITVANKIFEGPAEVLMRDEEGSLHSYAISVTEISNNMYFEITVTDKVLLETTGGIIQGMSGSPIIQKGQLIGVVTHTYADSPSNGKGRIIWTIDSIKN